MAANGTAAAAAVYFLAAVRGMGLSKNLFFSKMLIIYAEHVSFMTEMITAYNSKNPFE